MTTVVADNPVDSNKPSPDPPIKPNSTSQGESNDTNKSKINIFNVKLEFFVSGTEFAAAMAHRAVLCDIATLYPTTKFATNKQTQHFEPTSSETE